jgi:hypothetical protein
MSAFWFSSSAATALPRLMATTGKSSPSSSSRERQETLAPLVVVLRTSSEIPLG